ncbi:MAG: potassium channel protein [Thermodesulfovibrionales bacterium]|nr:potassium channel protein [Thermodesulfovibrionales bacterium]
MNADELSGFKEKFILSSTLFAFTIVVGTSGYWLIGGGKYSIEDCFYMTVITVATVGYREVVDISGSSVGKLFTVFLIFAGMSVILYFMSNVTAFLIEGDIKEIFRRKKMQKFISKMKDHYIVCGVGRLGLHVVDELHRTGRPSVVIDLDPEKTEAIKEGYPDAGVIVGDATDNDVLMAAGIDRAKGLIAATGHDKDNLVVTLTARQSGPSLRIVTRCNEIKNTDKFRRAGADSVVSSNLIGGLRMAAEMIRPAVVTFLDQMLRGRDKNLRIEEVRIPEGSPVIGDGAGSVKKHAFVLAVMRKDGDYEYNPPDDFTLKEGMAIVFMGSPGDRERLESAVRP